MNMITYSKNKPVMSDFISLDLEPKEPMMEAPSMNTNSGGSLNSTVWYKTPIYKAVAIIGFLIIMAFPHPEWLSAILTHPVGGILLAWGVGLALIPELEWWVIGLGVLSGYIILALSGLIETNLQNKR
jgi:hypothetical protein